MQSNPTKFQSIFFGNTPNCSITVNDIIIEPTVQIKLLGLTIDSKLKFSNHINNICITASRNLNALKRVAKSLPVNIKLLLYKTYILCHFNFCPLVWHFCGQSDTDKLESLQYRALRFVYADYESDYDTLLVKANMPTLQLSRLRALCTEVFKCTHNLSPQYMCGLFVLQDKSVHNTRSPKSVKQNHCNSVNNGIKTFVPYSTHLWNKLPNQIKNVTDLDTFKLLVNIWQGLQCNCNFCKSMANIT